MDQAVERKVAVEAQITALLPNWSLGPVVTVVSRDAQEPLPVAERIPGPRSEEAMARGEHSTLKKEARPQGIRGDPLGIGDDQRMYELDESALSALPPKE